MDNAFVTPTDKYIPHVKNVFIRMKKYLCDKNNLCLYQVDKSEIMNKTNSQQPGSFFDSFLMTLGTILGIGLAGLIGLIGCYVLLWAMGGVLIIADPLGEADAVVDLSGGDLDRIEEAALLFEEKYVKTLIITETGKKLPDIGTSYSTLLKGEARRLGVPDGAILITDLEANSTQEEAVAIRELMKKSELKSCIVVTDPFHSLRTRLIFRKEFQGSDLSVRVRPVRGHWYKSNTWWQSNAGWNATILEYIKLLSNILGV